MVRCSALLAQYAADSGWMRASSKSPRAIFCRNTRSTDASSRLSGTTPLVMARRYGRCSGYDDWKITSRPERKACAVAVAVDASVRARTVAPAVAAASEMMNPGNPHAPLSTSVMSMRLWVAGDPSTVLYAVITDRAPACCTSDRKGGKNRSSRARGLASMGYESRPPSPTFAMKCLGVVMIPIVSNARTCWRPITPVRWTSSPKVSSVRPHRTSVARFTTGESTMRMPRLRVSRAAASCTRRTSAESKVAARPIACGKTVAPSRMSPCRASSNGMMGIRRRERSRNQRWMESTRAACARAASCAGMPGRAPIWSPKIPRE
jgi:hypothetical protein